jgi:conjugative transfer region protein TrbK
MMSFKIVIRGLACVVLAVALLATVSALNNRHYQPAGALQAEPSSTANNLDAEQARCKALGNEAANEAGCKAVWQANRERFLSADKPDRGPDSVQPASNANEPAGGRPSSPSNRAGQPQ